MKKISAILLIFVLLLNSSFNSSSIFAASDPTIFPNNSSLDSAFAQLEKAFMSSEQQNYTLEITRGGKTDFKAKMLPKMTNAMIKAAVTKELNIIKYNIELKEDELGGLTKEDYKKISTQLIEGIKINKGHFQYEGDLKSVVLSFGIGGDEFYEFDNLKGNFVNMGSEKDAVRQADFEVKSDIERYIKQSIQMGNKFSQDIINRLPEKTDSLFKELQPSRIVAAGTIVCIHSSIFEADTIKYDGSESVESIIEYYRSILEGYRTERDKEKKREDFKFPDDEPSPDARKEIIEKILKGEISPSFTSGFNKAITLDELAKLYFESEEVDPRIELEEGTIDPNSPDYIKNAFIYGMIDDERDLNKPLTRLEAARKLINGMIYKEGVSTILRIGDSEKIPFADHVTVANSLKGMKTIGINFMPQAMYTKQQAILDKTSIYFYCIRGFDAPINSSSPSKIVVGRNTVHIQFEDKEQIEEFIQRKFDETPIGNIKRNGSYMRIDTGCALLEFFTTETGIKFTFKNGVKYTDFDEQVFGPELQYKIEPRVLKSNETVDMNMQPDSVHKKIYARVDAILAKIITDNMTAEQKVKAIHDYVVKHIKYDWNYLNEETAENLLASIDKGRGVCGDYTMFFQYLCDRASIPCVSEGGNVSTSSAGHAWNVVFLNGKWKFIDTTWDDDESNKVLYKYYLVDKFTFMKDHTPLMGIPDIMLYPEIDGMKIKSQDELRVYLLRKFYWIDGYKVTFRLTDKKLKPDIRYLWPTAEIKIVLTYDSKKDLYTVTAKAR